MVSLFRYKIQEITATVNCLKAQIALLRGSGGRNRLIGLSRVSLLYKSRLCVLLVVCVPDITFYLAQADACDIMDWVFSRHSQPCFVLFRIKIADYIKILPLLFNTARLPNPIWILIFYLYKFHNLEKQPYNWLGSIIFHFERVLPTFYICNLNNSNSLHPIMQR